MTTQHTTASGAANAGLHALADRIEEAQGRAICISVESADYLREALAASAPVAPAPQPAAHQRDGVPTWQAAQDPMLECSIQPRPLSHPLAAYHSAMSKGPLHYTWQDKPHRLVYDLIAAVKHYANQAGQAAPAAQGVAHDQASPAHRLKTEGGACLSPHHSLK